MILILMNILNFEEVWMKGLTLDSNNIIGYITAKENFIPVLEESEPDCLKQKEKKPPGTAYVLVLLLPREVYALENKLY